MDMQWAHLTRRYLAKRETEFLKQAIEQAPDTEIATFLNAFQEQNFQAVFEQWETLVAKWMEAMEVMEAGERETELTLLLVRLDIQARLAEIFHQFPLERQDAMLKSGLQGCEQATQVAEALQDQACKAFYLNMMASGLYSAGQLEVATQAYQEALSMRRELAALRPDVYISDVATTLNSLGLALSNLNRKEEAVERYQEALSIRRELASVSPDVYIYTLYVATTLNDLGATLSDLNRKEEAIEHFQEALSIHRHPAAVATTLNNLGNAFSDLDRLEEAVEHYRSAETIYRELAALQPDVYTSNVAGILNNLGNALSSLNRLKEAVEHYREALSIRRKMASARRDIYIYTLYVAGTLNSLGNALSDLNRKEEAVEHYREAETLYRELASARRDIFIADVATTLNNLGLALSDLNRKEEAVERYREAETIYRALALDRERQQKVAEAQRFWLDLAVIFSNWGRTEANRDGVEEARRLFEEAIRTCERGLRQLSEQSHRDIFKGKVEYAYDWLIQDYTARFQAGETDLLLRTVKLLEALRAIETISDIGHIAAETALLQETEDAGIVSTPLQPLNGANGALLYVQETRQSVVFTCILGEGGWTVSCDRHLLEPFGAMFSGIETVFASGRQDLPNMTVLGEKVFQSLPPPVRELFVSEQEVFLSLDSSLVNLPWEMLRIPGDNATEAYDDRWLGLRKLLPRILNRAQLDVVMKRQPTQQRDRKALLVANPTNDLRLISANLRIDTLYEILPPTFNLDASKPLMGDTASVEEVLKAFATDTDKLALFVYHGHGDRPEKQELEKQELEKQELEKQGETEYLVLAEGKALSPSLLAPFTLPGTLCFLTSCTTGTTRAHGGGRYDGFSVVLLERGASCVVANVHSIYVVDADIYARAMDRAMLEQGMEVGEAMLQTRREVARQPGNNPLAWAIPILWGNPTVKLA